MNNWANKFFGLKAVNSILNLSWMTGCSADLVWRITRIRLFKMVKATRVSIRMASAKEAVS